MWHKRYSWSSNPFSAKYNTKLVGYERQKQMLMDYISSGDLCILTGEAGTGKTSLLKWLQANMNGHRLLYLNTEDVDDAFDLKKYTKSLLRQKKTVLLLDEAQFCDDGLRSQLKALWDQGKIKSAIITQPNADLASYNESIRSRIGNRVVRLKKMETTTAKELISLRTGDKNPFTEEMIGEIAAASKYNPRKILENCEAVCIAHNGKEITMQGVKEVLEQKRKEALMNLELLEEPTLPDNLAPMDKINLKGFSPMQQRLIKLLYEGNRTAKQLAKVLNTTEGSVGKQLSNLIEQNAVAVINHRRPKLYGLQGSFKSNLL